MPVQGYSTAELLALRNAPLAQLAQAHDPRLRADPESHVFQREVLENHHASFAFAHYDPDLVSRQLVVPELRTTADAAAGPAVPAVRWATDVPTSDVFSHSGRLTRWMRYGRSVACFNLYPASQRDLQVNDLLWRVAHEGEYRPGDGNLLLENNVLSLAMPHKFFSFLAGISREDLKTCMLQVLALIAEDEDAEGLALMRSELEDSVWNDLNEYMATRGAYTPLLDGTTERGVKLMRDVEMLLTLCYLSPWKIDVYVGYITPQDMSMVLSEAQRNANSPAGSALPAQDVSDRKLVRSSARRPVSFGPSVPHGSPPPHRTTSKTKRAKTVVFWKLFQDWRRHRKVLVQGLGIHPKVVAQTMLHSIAHGSQNVAWDRAELVMACACTPGNLFSSLPREVVFNIIAPHVLLAGLKE